MLVEQLSPLHPAISLAPDAVEFSSDDEYRDPLLSSSSYPSRLPYSSKHLRPTPPLPSRSQSRALLLSPELAREEERRIDERQRREATEKTEKSYNPENKRVRIVSSFQSSPSC